MIRIAVLDDYQNVSLQMADWTNVHEKAEVTVFLDHILDENKIIRRLAPFDVVCVMRERTPLTRNILKKLSRLKLIISTGKRNASIDQNAAKAFGITIKHTSYLETGAPEMTWALLLAIAKHLPQENHNLKSGQWQQRIGTDLAGKTIGIIGLGRVGQKVAAFARAFDMKVIAWSENLRAEKAAEHGAVLVSKESLLQWSDFVSLHLVLSDRSRNTLGAAELALMKPTAYLINAARGPLVDEAALIKTLQQNRIAGAALDVFDTEPLPADHPFRKLDNVLATPHTGYVTENTYRMFYRDTVQILQEWLD